MKETCRTGHKETYQDNSSLLDKAARVGEVGQGRQEGCEARKSRTGRTGSDRISLDRTELERTKSGRSDRARQNILWTGQAQPV